MSASFDFRQIMQMNRDLTLFKADFEVFLQDFLRKMGYMALARTKKRTPVDTGELRRKWELSPVYKVGDDLWIELINPQEYASHIEYGHMQHKRWVPGVFKNGRFQYEAGAKTGIMLKTKFIEGFYMATISIKEIENEMPSKFRSSFSAFVSSLGTFDGGAR